MPTQNEALLEAYAARPPSAQNCYTLEIRQSSFAEPSRARLCEAVPRTGRSDVHHRGSADQWLAAGGTMVPVTKNSTKPISFVIHGAGPQPDSQVHFSGAV